MPEAENPRHTCLLYEGEPSEPIAVVAPLIEDALRQGYRCLYLADPATLTRAAGALEARGVEVSALAARGALVLSAERPHLDAGGFRPEAMVDSLEGLIDRALADGFEGLFATGDVAWELGEGADLGSLLDYETRLETLFHRKPLRGICQYRRGALPPRALHDALRAHPRLMVNGSSGAANLLFMPAELQDARLDAAQDARGEWVWRQVKRAAELERERDRALEELRRAKEELERRVAERTEELRSFTYAAAHDLRAPLRSIDGFAAIIERRHAAALPPEARELFDHMRAGARKLSDLLDGLLALSRLSTAEVRKDDVDLSGLARASLERLRAAQPERRVTADIQPGLAARGDSRLLASALDNLLGNAWKFTAGREDARIEVGAEESAGERRFFVRDNGAGFDAAGQAERLFQPFQRFHSAREFPGSGLGLAIVRRVIERHGGSVRLESAPGRGAAVSFTLPGA